MWQIENKTAFGTAGCFLRGAEGHEFWCVALHVTFQADGAGKLSIAPDQLSVRMMAVYSEDANQILEGKGDFIPFASLTDLSLTGTVMPPDTSHLPVSRRV